MHHHNVCKLYSNRLVVSLQAVVGMHQKGRGVCDIKPGNVRVCVAPDGTILGGTLLDLGGSVAHDGQSVCVSVCLSVFRVGCLVM